MVVCVTAAGFGIALLWWWEPEEVCVPFCGLHLLTGLHCPGCGTIRATHELLHGRFLSAVRYNVLWTASLPLTLYLLVSEWRVWTGRPSLSGRLLHRPWFWIVVAAIATIFFVLRNLPGEPFSLLAPPT